MNNTFDINRLGKLIRFDGVQFSQKLLKSIIIIEAAIFFGAWMFISALRTTSLPDERSFMFYLSVFLVSVFNIERLYGDNNDPKKGIQFAMLPASTLEKTISIIFYCCIVLPLTCLILSLIMDSILAVLPFGGFEGFTTLSSFSGNDYGTTLTSFISTTLIFILGTVLFKKRQTVKTIACCMGCFAIVITIMSLFFSHFHGGMTWSISPEDINNSLIGKLITIFAWVLNAVVVCLIYLRIKKQKY